MQRSESVSDVNSRQLAFDVHSVPNVYRLATKGLNNRSCQSCIASRMRPGRANGNSLRPCRLGRTRNSCRASGPGATNTGKYRLHKSKGSSERAVRKSNCITRPTRHAQSSIGDNPCFEGISGDAILRYLAPVDIHAPKGLALREKSSAAARRSQRAAVTTRC
jgi:hypothetical protein